MCVLQWSMNVRPDVITAFFFHSAIWLELQYICSRDRSGIGIRPDPSAARLGLWGAVCAKNQWSAIFVNVTHLYMWSHIYTCEATFVYVTSHLYMWLNIYKCDSTFICDSTFVNVTAHLYMWLNICKCDSAFINVVPHLYMWSCD